MEIRKYLEKFLNAFSEAAGLTAGFLFVAVPLTLLSLKFLETIHIDKETVNSFLLLLGAITLLTLLHKVSK